MKKELQALKSNHTWVFTALPPSKKAIGCLIGVDSIRIYRVFCMYFCNLNARFTPIFLKITLIPHLLMFCRNIKKRKQRKGLKKRKQKLCSKALLCRGKEVHQGEYILHRGEGMT